MPCDSLSALELRHLKSIALHFISASYWEDETIKRYWALGLVSCDERQIHLTEEGMRSALGDGRAVE